MTQQLVQPGATSSPRDPQPDRGGMVPPKLEPKKLTAMEKLERRSQAPIVIIMAIVAALRTVFIFTDRVIDFSRVAGLNIAISLITGLALAFISEITISIAGRRHKLFKVLQYQAEMSGAVAKKRDKDLWSVEMRRLKEQVSANLFMMRLAIGMSLYAAASYLVESVGTTGAKHDSLVAQGASLLSAVMIAGYAQYLVYFHGVQTDEIKEDQSEALAVQVQNKINEMRVLAMENFIGRLSNAELTPAQEFGFIGSGLPVTAQNQYAPLLRMLAGLRPEDADEEDHAGRIDTSGWYSLNDIAILQGKLPLPNITQLTSAEIRKKTDNIKRPLRSKLDRYRDRFGDIACEGKFQLDPTRSYIVEPSFAHDFFELPSGVSIQAGTLVVDSVSPVD